jgi:hypothetical protein
VQLREQYFNHEMKHVEWQDTLAMRALSSEVERIFAKSSEASHAYLVLQLPRFAWPVFYHDAEMLVNDHTPEFTKRLQRSVSSIAMPRAPASTTGTATTRARITTTTTTTTTPTAKTSGTPGGGTRRATSSMTDRIIAFDDPGLTQDNLLEYKYLALSQRIDEQDQNLRPSLEDARKLAV